MNAIIYVHVLKWLLKPRLECRKVAPNKSYLFLWHWVTSDQTGASHISLGIVQNLRERRQLQWASGVTALLEAKEDREWRDATEMFRELLVRDSRNLGHTFWEHLWTFLQKSDFWCGDFCPLKSCGKWTQASSNLPWRWNCDNINDQSIPRARSTSAMPYKITGRPVRLITSFSWHQVESFILL